MPMQGAITRVYLRSHMLAAAAYIELDVSGRTVPQAVHPARISSVDHIGAILGRHRESQAKPIWTKSMPPSTTASAAVADLRQPPSLNLRVTLRGGSWRSWQKTGRLFETRPVRFFSGRTAAAHLPECPDRAFSLRRRSRSRLGGMREGKRREGGRAGLEASGICRRRRRLLPGGFMCVYEVRFLVCLLSPPYELRG